MKFKCYSFSLPALPADFEDCSPELRAAIHHYTRTTLVKYSQAEEQPRVEMLVAALAKAREAADLALTKSGAL